MTRPDLILTPYEKNIEIWRQLWRVCENSHLLLQIVDARDPLFYRCEDLEEYLVELNQAGKGKEGIDDRTSWLIINKGDLIAEDLRKVWQEYLKAQGIQFVFFSAFQEHNRLLKQEQQARHQHNQHLYHKAHKQQLIRRN